MGVARLQLQHRGGTRPVCDRSWRLVRCSGRQRVFRTAIPFISVLGSAFAQTYVLRAAWKEGAIQPILGSRTAPGCFQVCIHGGSWAGRLHHHECMNVGREGAELAFLMIAGRGTAPHWPAILVLVSIPVMDVLFPFPSDAISWSVLCSPAPRLRRPPLARDSPPRGARGAVLPIDVRRRCPKGRHGISTVV